jgi:hypothetical protein
MSDESKYTGTIKLPVDPDAEPDNPMHAVGTPHWFAKEVLGIELYEWQDKVLWDLAVGDKPVALAAANGSGKTQGIALVALLWHASCFANSQGLTTAGVYRQVKEQLWGALRQEAGKLGKGWKINQTDFEAPNGSKALGFSTDNPKSFEGFHQDNQLLILDEAKAIPDEIWEAAQRCNVPDGSGGKVRILIMSSTDRDEGFFYEAFHSKREHFHCHRVTSYDCPHLSEKWIQGQIDYWGRNHRLVRSMIFSEFVSDGTSPFVVPPHQWSDCVDTKVEHKPGMPLVFIDWAAGGDENVLAIVNGNRLDHLVHWREKDTQSAANRAMIEIIRRGVPPHRVFADDGGLGRPINDFLATKGFPVRRVLNNAASNKSDHFANLGAELWYEAARMIEAKELILPDDPILMQQSTSRKSVVTPAGKLALEKKEDMRKRGLNSPDRADAVLSAFTLAKVIGNEYSDTAHFSSELSDSQFTEQEEAMSGMFAGL